LERSLNGISFGTIGNFTPEAISYNDKNVEVMNESYIYRIYTIDSCNFTSEVSNIGKSILLNVDEESKEFPEPYWTTYEGWTAGVNSYELSVYNANIRKDEKIADLNSLDTNFLDKRTKINQANYCYTITALRNGDERISKSNTVCAATPFNIQIPNAFTPNGDGLNDSLKIIGTHILSFELKIFNRWGQLMFETNDILDKWDGTYMGEACPSGVYYLWIDARGTMYQRQRYKGSITILR
jgi:gliding motility-associated-like protein